MLRYRKSTLLGSIGLIFFGLQGILLPVCDCDSCVPDSVPNSTINPDQSTFNQGEVVTYACDTGFNHTSGDLVRTCQPDEDDTWTGGTPVCSVISCDPDEVQNATITTSLPGYNYTNIVTYGCDVGFNHSSGDLSRTCTGDGSWNGTAPACESISCNPEDIQNATVTTSLPLYNYTNIVTYGCDVGFNHSSGDLSRTCTGDGSWNGTAPVCEIISCDPDEVQNATITTSLPVYNYTNIVTYDCDLGFHHSSGDLSRTCTGDGSWNGTAPVCEIVTCPPPSDVLHATYSPVDTSYVWPAEVEYTCDSTHHYISGGNKTTCNENGTFPDINFDCSVLHSLSIDAASPSLIWINSSSPSGNFNFKFDGTCDVTFTSNPVDKLSFSSTISGNDLTVSVSQNAQTVSGSYVVTAEPKHAGSTYATESFDVYFGNYIVDLQVAISGGVTTIAIGRDYDYTVSTSSSTHVTEVTLTSVFEADVENGNESTSITGQFSSHVFTYAFTQAGLFTIAFSAENPVTDTIDTNLAVDVIASINNCSIIAEADPMPSATPTRISIEFASVAMLPMKDISITFDHPNGTQIQVNDTLGVGTSLPYIIVLLADLYYDVQGVYTITATVANAVSTKDISKDLEVWDDITGVTLELLNSTAVFVTGDTFATEFRNVPPTGFQYTVDYLDGNSESSVGTSVMYTGYAHEVFSKSYTTSGIRYISYTVWNGGYNKQGILQVTIENTVKNLTAAVQNPMTTLEVDTLYTFEVTATEGTNVTLDWDMGDGNTVQNQPLGELLSDTITHTYTSPGDYLVLVTATNLVSTASYNFTIGSFYKPNHFELTSSKSFTNITTDVEFYLTVTASAGLPMNEVTYTLDYNHTAPAVTDTVHMWSNLSLPTTFTHSYTFTQQGNYYVIAHVENLLNHLNLTILVRVWDGLDDLDFDYVNDNGVYLTNTTAQFEFVQPPDSGFKYTIDYGDGTVVDYQESEIYLRPYNLTVFEHVYTHPGVYTLSWSGFNEGFSRSETKTILVQNPVPSTGFTLEPDNKKYPWINLQSLSIPINITLENVGWPTNTTCIFYPSDGTPNVPNLPFVGELFEYTHSFLTEGNFTPSFNCSNLESYYVYEYNITVQKCVASFVSLEYAEVVPLNRSDTVDVLFNIEDTNFAWIPYDVTLDFDFGDGTTSRKKRAPVVYDKRTYTHTYTERGNYTVTLTTSASVTGTTNTLAYSLRLGTMYFAYSDTIAYINHTLVRYTMHGVLGPSTVYTLDFDDNTVDGTCNSPDYNGCYVDHYCPFYGYKLVYVTASNGSFVEVDWVNVTCDNPITVGLDVPWTVSVPTGNVELKLYLNESALYLPVLNILVHMGDPINRDTYNFTEEITYANPFVFPFTYIALGRHTITVYCWNLINETSFETKITVTNENFLFTGSFDRKYSQFVSPMYLSSMRDMEIFSRLFINANRTQKFHVNNWTIQADVQQDVDRHSLVFTIGLLEEKKYSIVLKTSFIEEPNNVIQEPTFVEFVATPPHVEILGGTRRHEKLGSTTMDAFTLSYDLARPNEQNLTFTWNCVGYSVANFEAAENKHLNGDSGVSCDFDVVSSGIIQLNTFETPATAYYTVTVQATNTRGEAATFTQILQATGSPNPLSIRCQINCLAKLGVTSYLQLVPDIDNNCPADYTWLIRTKSGGTVDTSVNILQVLVANNLTNTDPKSKTLSIKPNAFDYGRTYLVSLTVVTNGQVYGPAYYEFTTNQIPKGGTCDIIPFNDKLQELPALDTAVVYEARALIDLFNLTCQDWMDEGFSDSTFTTREPLFYFFFARYKGDTYERQILYYDPGSTSNLVPFQIGQRSNNYELEVVMRIVDVFGDFTEFVYTVKSVPDPSITSNTINGLTDQQQVDIVKPYLEQFDDELIKANRSWDYRTLARRITGVVSLYNDVTLNGTSSKIITPEELTNLGSDGGLGWSDYWNIIVEVEESLLANHLIKKGEEYVSYLYESISTWPEDRRITLPTIQTVSRALGATLFKKDYANVTAAIMASKITDTLAVNLASHVQDRTFPVTRELLSAVEGVAELCQNILAELQTVLTPNLPEDPTTDEMRQFLEFINVFNDEDGVEALSLQEQTFLAQKQLQKYYLDKYIKSRASKESLPLLTFALRNLTFVLSRLTDIGQPMYSIENDFFALSAEVVPATNLKGTLLSRPRVAVEVHSLTGYDPGLCEAATIPVQVTVFKENPYFWGQFADRITSYVPVFEFGSAMLGGSTIIYQLDNKVVPECVDETPTYTEGDQNKMIYILFNRKFADDDILIFIRPNTTELIYDVYLNSVTKPDLEEQQFEFTTSMRRDANYTLEDGHKLLIKSSSFKGVGKIWVGLKPILENTDDLSLLYLPFCANVTSVSCLSWVADDSGQYYWDKDACEVSTASTKVGTVCECQNTNKTLTIGTTFLVPPNKVDFLRLEIDNSPIGRAPVVGIVVVMFVSYFLLLLWAWREDAKDQYKWAYSLLIDNDIADTYFYAMRVFTGMRSGSGTKSNIAFILAGEKSDTGIRMLDDQSHIGFETGSVRTFVMSTRRRLSHLMSMRIWHDDSGLNDSAWYLNKITVQDLQTFVKYTFVCEDWLDFDQGDQKVDRVLSAEKSTTVWSFKDMTSYTIAEHHIWASVILRPFRSDFTRIQRLSCLYGQLFMSMVLTSMFIKSTTREEIEKEVSITSLRFSEENFEAAIACVTVATVLISIVGFFFRFARTKQRSEDAINSPLRKFYRRVNDKVSLDTSVLKSTYNPPAERAVYHNLNFLPGMLAFLGWVCLLLTVICATLVVFLMSDTWKLRLSEEWMTTILVECLVSFFIIEILKIAIIVLLYSLLCQRAYEPTEPYIDLESLKEITKYNSATLTVNPDFSNDLKPAVSPDEETLLTNKSDRVQDHQLLKMFSQLALYSGILYLVYTISYESRDMRSYYLKSNIENMFQFKEEVKDLASYRKWLNGRFIDQYFANSYYGAGLNTSEITYKYFAKDLVNYRIGPARLRQLRTRPELCIGPLALGRTCYNGYKEKYSSKSDYCIGWKHKPCPVSEKSQSFSSPGWEYMSASEVWGFVTVAEYTSYAGGGFFMKLDVNREVSEKIFAELMENNWFDRATRAVILEFTMYNANTNLFVYSKFVAEFTEIGGVITFMDIHVFRLLSDTGPDGDFIQLLKFVFLLLVIVACIRTLYGICAEGLVAYFKSPWNLLDVMAVSMSVVTISIYIYKITIINRTTALFLDDKNAYVGFENLAFYDFVVNTTHGILVFLLSVRVSRILGYSGKIHEMAAVISNAAQDLVAFIVIFGITYFAYVILGTMLFGSENEKYKDLFNTYGTITEAIVGKNRLAKILVDKPLFAEFYYFTFVLFVLFTLTTMAAAILNFSISTVKEETAKLAPTNIVEVILDRLSKLGNFITGKIKSKHNDGDANRPHNDRDNPEVNINDVLLDFHVFIRGIDAADKQFLMDNKSTSKTPPFRDGSPLAGGHKKKLSFRLTK